MIKAEVKDGKARIEIIGSIAEYEYGCNSSQGFRARIKEIIADGVRDAHIYINSGGGSCLEVSEMENIISSFPGTVTGEGGAIVASAASYLACCLSDFKVAQNTKFMIHKPYTWVGGNETEIENVLTSIRQTTSIYRAKYLARTGMKAEDFDAKWNSGDWWMSANEASENGFVSGISGKAEIDGSTLAMFAACASLPAEIKEELKIYKDKEEMNLTEMAKKLGLPPTATQQEVDAAIDALNARALESESLNKKIGDMEKAGRDREIKVILDAAEQDKRITAATRAAWEKSLQSDYENAKTLIEGLAPIVKLSSATGGPATGTGTSTAGKTFEQMQEDPESLAALEEQNPEEFERLFAEYKKRKKIK